MLFFFKKPPVAFDIIPVSDLWSPAALRLQQSCVPLEAWNLYHIGYYITSIIIDI